jgi:hypothetical protein
MKPFFLFLFLSLPTLGQVHEVAEMTMILPEDIDEEIDIHLINEEELLLINLQENTTARREKKISIKKFDKNLNELWEAIVPIDKFNIPINARVFNERLYYIFQVPETNKLELISLDLITGTWNRYALESLTKLQKVNFDIFNGYIFISGEYNNKPVIEMHGLSISASKVLPEIHYKNTIVQGVYGNPYRGHLYVLTKLVTKCQILVITYDETGKFISKSFLGDKKHKISNAQIRFTTEGEPMIFGSFNNVCNDLVTGFFSGSLDRHAQLTFTNISDLSSIKSSLSPRRQEKSMLRREQGKSDLVRQRILFSIPFFGENSYVAAGEIYSQQNLTKHPTAMVGYGTRGTRLPSIYEYKINKVLLAEVSFDGKVNQNDLVKIESKNFLNLSPQTAYFFQNENIYGILPYKNDLNYFNTSGPTGEVQTHRLFPAPQYKINDINVDLLNWSPSTVLAYGVAYVEFPNGLYTSIRQLYFVKKLAIQSQ